MSEQLYVLIKRDLYECPEHMGYTGIKELAGAWPLSLVQSESVPVKDSYDRRDHGHYDLPVDLAPDFTAACFHDLAQSHLQKKVAAKDTKIAQLETALRLIAAPRDCGCSPVCQCDSEVSQKIDLDFFRDTARAALEINAEKIDAPINSLKEKMQPLLGLLDALVAESGREVGWGEEDSFRMGEWFEAHDLASIEAARAALKGDAA